MANGNGRSGWSPHRRLVGAETILVAGVVQELLQRQIKAFHWPHWGQTLWIMGCTLGMLGGVLLVLRMIAKKAVKGTHRAARRLPFPVPLLVLHAAVLAGLFVLYACIWNLWPPF